MVFERGPCHENGSCRSEEEYGMVISPKQALAPNRFFSICNEDKLGKGESYREKIVYFASLSIRNQFEVHLGSDFHLSKGDFFFFLFSWILDALNLRWH